MLSVLATTRGVALVIAFLFAMGMVVSVIFIIVCDCWWSWWSSWSWPSWCSCSCYVIAIFFFANPIFVMIVVLPPMSF